MGNNQKGRIEEINCGKKTLINANTKGTPSIQVNIGILKDGKKTEKKLEAGGGLLQENNSIGKIFRKTRDCESGTWRRKKKKRKESARLRKESKGIIPTTNRAFPRKKEKGVDVSTLRNPKGKMAEIGNVVYRGKPELKPLGLSQLAGKSEGKASVSHPEAQEGKGSSEKAKGGLFINEP